MMPIFQWLLIMWMEIVIREMKAMVGGEVRIFIISKKRCSSAENE